MPFAEPMPDTITDYFNIRQGLAEAERRSPGCLKLVHHPSDRRWAMKDLMESFRGGVRFLELNPCDEPMTYSIALWVRCLSSGLHFMGTLSTDAHGLGGIRRFGHVLVNVGELTGDAVLGALKTGEFVAVEEGCRAVPVRVSRPGPDGGKYLVVAEGAAEIRFLGVGGHVLNMQRGDTGSYAPKAEDVYVRAEVLDPEGLRFLTQPVMVA
jgi:hypothetical protein